MIGFDQRSRLVVRQNAAVTVSGLHRRPVKDEDDEQQTEPTRQGVSLILKCAHQHAGHYEMC